MTDQQVTEAANLVVLEQLRQLALGGGLTRAEREAVYRLTQDMLGVKLMSRPEDLAAASPYRLPPWAPLASVALSAVAFVVSLMAVFT